jgi:hypothetical protein
MKTPLLAAAAALVLAACSQAHSDDSSCVEKANKEFDRCILTNKGNCTAKRLSNVAVCDENRADGRQ